MWRVLSASVCGHIPLSTPAETCLDRHYSPTGTTPHGEVQQADAILHLQKNFLFCRTPFPSITCQAAHYTWRLVSAHAPAGDSPSELRNNDGDARIPPPQPCLAISLFSRVSASTPPRHHIICGADSRACLTAYLSPNAVAYNMRSPSLLAVFPLITRQQRHNAT